MEICCKSQLLLVLQIGMLLHNKESCACVPGKIYNYLRAGPRILAPVDSHDIRQLIEEHDCGVVVPPKDPSAIASALSDEFDRWEKRRSDSVDSTTSHISAFERRNLTRQLADLIFEVVGLTVVNDLSP